MISRSHVRGSFLLLWAVAGLGLAYLGYVHHRPKVLPPHQYHWASDATSAGDKVVYPVLAHRPLRQAFKAKGDGLSRLQVFLPTYGRINTSRLTIILFRLPPGQKWPTNRSSSQEVARRDLKAETLTDWDELWLDLPRPERSAGVGYVLEISSRDATEENCVGVQGQSQGNGLFVADSPSEGSLDVHLVYDVAPLEARGKLFRRLAWLVLMPLGLWLFIVEAPRNAAFKERLDLIWLAYALAMLAHWVTSLALPPL